MTEAKKRVKSATTVLIEQNNCFPKRWKDKIEKPMFALNWKYWNHFIISRNQRYLASENNNEGKLFVWKGKGEVDLTGKRGELCVCLFWASLIWQSRCVRVALSLLLARSRLSPVNRVDRLVAGVRRKERQREMKKRERGNTSLFMFRLKIEWQSFYNKECPLDFPFDSIRRYKCTCRAESIWSDCISFMIEHYSPIYSFEITKFFFVLFFWKKFRALVFWSNQMPFGIEWKLNWNRRASIDDLILCYSRLNNKLKISIKWLTYETDWVLPKCSPVSMLRAPAPPPNPYPFGPYLRAWQTLQKSSFSWVLALVESNILLHKPSQQSGIPNFNIKDWSSTLKCPSTGSLW